MLSISNPIFDHIELILEFPTGKIRDIYLSICIYKDYNSNFLTM